MWIGDGVRSPNARDCALLIGTGDTEQGDRKAVYLLAAKVTKTGLRRVPREGRK